MKNLKDSKTYIVLFLFLICIQLKVYGQIDSTRNFKKIQISTGGNILVSFGETYPLGVLQTRYRYTPRKALEIGLIKDFFRKPRYQRQPYTGFRNGYYISHHWALNNPYRKTKWWFGAKLLYAQGEIAYDTNLDGSIDFYAPSALYNIYDLFFEHQFLKHFSVRANVGLAISYFYGTNISRYLATTNVGLCLGYNFLK